MSSTNEADQTTSTVCTDEETSCGNYTPYIICGVAIVAIIAGAITLLAKKYGKNSEKKQNGQAKSNSIKTGSNSGKLIEIYVGNLSYEVDDAILLKQFTKFGVIKSARVVINRHNNKSKGYGFVEMPHREEAEIAIKKLNNHELMGRPMKVNEARRDSRPPERR